MFFKVYFGNGYIDYFLLVKERFMVKFNIKVIYFSGKS